MLNPTVKEVNSPITRTYLTKTAAQNKTCKEKKHIQLSAARWSQLRLPHQTTKPCTLKLLKSTKLMPVESGELQSHTINI